MINGKFLDGRSAASVDATLDFAAAAIQVHGLAEPLVVSLADIRVSERIAAIPRRIEMRGGAVFESTDNDAIDAACRAHGIALRSGLVHWLESRWPVALASLAAVVLIAIGLVRWGIPATTDWVARKIPENSVEVIGKNTLATLDQYVLTRSRLDSRRQDTLWMKFMDMTSSLDDGHRYSLEFRSGGRLGANALALPSGTVIMTDELVELAESDEELVAVMAHEVGHVRARHALRQMLQAAGISGLAMALTGDLSSVSSILAMWPVLVTARNSRAFEAEADAFARQWLREHDIAESNFEAILCRMTDGIDDVGIRSYFSSHPPTTERADCGHAE